MRAVNEEQFFFHLQLVCGQHYGHLGRFRENEVRWPEDAEKTWEEVSKIGWNYKYHGWNFRRIHRTLGFDDVTDIEQRRSKCCH